MPQVLHDGTYRGLVEDLLPTEQHLEDKGAGGLFEEVKPPKATSLH